MCEEARKSLTEPLVEHLAEPLAEPVLEVVAEAVADRVLDVIEPRVGGMALSSRCRTSGASNHR